MWLIKLIGFLAMASCGAYLGHKKSSHYKIREKILGEIIRLCDSMVNDITYFQPAVTEMLKKRLNNYSALAPSLSDYVELLENNAVIQIDTLKTQIAKGPLMDDEFILFIQLLDILGKSDSQSQRIGITSIKEAFLIKHQAALDECKKYGGLYFKLGILGGLTAGVIIL